MQKLSTTGRFRLHLFANVLKSGFGSGVLMLLFLSSLVLIAISRLSPPGIVSKTAPATDFSSGRAMEHLKVIGRAPHPVGSLEHAAVRKYIIGELSSWGLQPETHETSVVLFKWGSINAATVRNITARLKGTGSGKALLVVSHYDTAHTSPGASDDGASVASMLETLRALKACPPLKNDIIFLFTDGEEIHHLGAKAFIDEHPWAKEVGLVLNLEARGASGPAIMFETSDGNNWLIEEFAKVAPHPVANSLSYEIYKLLPNDTDLTIFKSASLPGINFACIDDFMRYHTQTDSVENIDERSLQHRGASALALTRHFGDLELDRSHEGNAVYFDVLGMTVLHYPARWVIPLTILTLALFVTVIALGFMKKRLTSKGMTAGVFLFMFNAIVVVGVVTLIWRLVCMLQLRAGRSLRDDYYHSKLYLASFVILAVAITAVLYNLYRQKANIENLTVGGLFCWLLLLMVTSVFLPGASYLLIWPLLFGLVSLGFMLRTEAKDPNSLTRFMALSICAVPGVVLLVPMIYLVFVAMGIEMIAAVMAMVMLLCGLLIPHFALMSVPGKWWLPGGATFTAASLLAAAIFNPGFNKQYPAQNHLFYAFSADMGNAVWASSDLVMDEWTSQFFPANAERGPLRGYLPLDTNSYLKAPAPVKSFQPADIRVISDSTRGDLRILLIHVTSSYEGISLVVAGDANVEVAAAVVNGSRVESSRPGRLGQPPIPWRLQYWSPPKEGIDLTLELKGSRPVVLKTLEQSYRLYETFGASIKPRPDHIVPSTFWNSDLILIGKSHTL
jgi:Peptidase family M28